MVRILPPEHLVTKKNAAIASGAILIGAAAVVLYIMTRPTTNVVAPAYDIVLPQRTPVEDLGGWRRVSPENNDPVFAYDDKIGDVDIMVSQQPIPASFMGNVAANVRDIAEKGSYSTVIEAGGTDVYIGRSARGPQSAVFAKNNVLVFIKTTKTISQADWIRYINSLVDPKTEQLPTF